MKTKTKTIYLSDSGVKQMQSEAVNNSAYTLEYSYVEYARFKHKTTVEIPDNKTVSISESEFEKAWSEANGENWPTLHADLKNRIFNR